MGAELNELIMYRVLDDSASAVRQVFRRDVGAMFDQCPQRVRAGYQVVFHARRRLLAPVACCVSLRAEVKLHAVV